MPNLETLSMPRLPINGQDILLFARAVKNEATWTQMKFVILHGPDPTATDREAKFLQSAVGIVRERVMLGRAIDPELVSTGFGEGVS